MNSLTHFAFLWTAVPVEYTRRPDQNELSSLSKRSLHKWKQLKRRYDVRKYREACRCQKTRISYWSAKLSAHRFSWRFRRITFIAVECSSSKQLTLSLWAFGMECAKLFKHSMWFLCCKVWNFITCKQLLHLKRARKSSENESFKPK